MFRTTLRLTRTLILVLFLSPLQFLFRDGHYLSQSALELLVLLRWRRIRIEFRLHAAIITQIEVTLWLFVLTATHRSGTSLYMMSPLESGERLRTAALSASTL
jgi:hypothetical protein